MPKHITLVATAILAAPVALLSACGNNKESANESTSSSAMAAPAGTEQVRTQLRSPDGREVANATFDFANGFATLTVETVAPGILAPGFHGMHVHSVGKCEPNSVAPTGGAPGDFLSAGGHFQAPGHTGAPQSGDLTSLEVRPDGSAKLVTTTSAFTAEDLRGGSGTALIIHEQADNFGNIPPRYSVNGKPGPDQETLDTGDAGKRVACGVLAAPTNATTSTSTSTSTVTTTATPAAPAETTGTTTETTTSSPAAETTSTTSGTATTTTSPVTTTTATSTPENPQGPGG
ncbi:MAG: superoxide dismutase family protein [Mycobacterium sp.]